MIQCKLFNKSDYSLSEREHLYESLCIDESLPHVMLKTCNRVEVYWGEGRIDENDMRHLFRVASGLESSLIGERAIQGQLKLAYQEASHKYKLSSQLHKLFQIAIHAGKRVRTETKISEGAMSHSQITVDILKKEKVDLQNKIVSIIGVNKLTEDILKYLVSNKAVNIFLSNRHLDKAQNLADKYNGTAVSLENKQQMLEFTDVLISATSAPHTIIKKDDIRADKDMIIFDLAFPRDVDDALRNFENIKLYDLEDIEKQTKESLNLRYKEIEFAEVIIEEEIEKLYEWSRFQLSVNNEILNSR
jgi:glutamyl-tRNA reductase